MEAMEAGTIRPVQPALPLNTNPDVCMHCGSSHVLEKVWVHMNSYRGQRATVIDAVEGDSGRWCEECNEATETEDARTFLNTIDNENRQGEIEPVILDHLQELVAINDHDQRTAHRTLGARLQEAVQRHAHIRVRTDEQPG
jgi:hypothetical protein